VTCEGVYGHWHKGHDYEPSDRLKMRYILLTFPKVPSAISCTTVYSPSFDAGMTGIGSCSLIVAVILGRVRCPDEPAAAKISYLAIVWLLFVILPHYDQLLAYEGRAQFAHCKGEGC
jgi:hypothetical protein